ncbi:hypothetical protein CYMTET_55089 [Cymbomonas tetramitiformis]|uniref:Uncharacterized protein n=1 Tax=Cymbomonas tetramitiformis TaxID=36881 RepID=A0AAE0BDF3_9CHLO|nr:hypothetical protein CYMTET_55089 [Cymbomonas tetramitiformis]
MSLFTINAYAHPENESASPAFVIKQKMNLLLDALKKCRNVLKENEDYTDLWLDNIFKSDLNQKTIDIVVPRWLKPLKKLRENAVLNKLTEVERKELYRGLFNFPNEVLGIPKLRTSSTTPELNMPLLGSTIIDDLVNIMMGKDELTSAYTELVANKDVGKNAALIYICAVSLGAIYCNKQMPISRTKRKKRHVGIVWATDEMKKIKDGLDGVFTSVDTLGGMLEKLFSG